MNKVIAVSSQGFSEPAERKAKDHGIELMTLEDAEKIDWAKELAHPFFKMMTHQHALLTITGIDARGISRAATSPRLWRNEKRWACFA